MADDFKKYLAAEILSEQHTVSYRTVSRALKVRVHAAKCMLYEFYEFQNGTKPGSIHATYLLSGVKKRPVAVTNGHKHDYDEDEHIPSSPPPFTSSMLEPSQQSSEAEEEEAKQVPVKTITLVRQEDLEHVKGQYESIASIHVYSLSPTRIPDLVTLTDLSRAIFADVFVKEDPLKHYKTYGIVQNPDVRRRKGKRPVIPTGPPPKFQPVKEETKRSKPAINESTPAKDDESSRPSSRDSTSTNTPATKPKPTTLKRDSSDLFKAFAKQSQSKTASAPKPAEKDTEMKDTPTPLSDNEGESEDEALFLDTNTRKAATSKKRPSDAKREKEERAAKLRKLMDSDEEDEEPAVPDVEKASGLGNDEPVATQKDTDTASKPAPKAEEADEVAWSESDGESKPQEPKRRRGKRRVTKKRTVKDEDGYLVTKEEAVWESFSEDEPQPVIPPKKIVSSAAKGSNNNGFGGMAKSQTSNQTQSQGKTAPGSKKKGAAGGGGGNIMSFFGKKGA